MTNSDLTRLINSDEIQSIVRPPKVQKRGRPLKKNPLKNLGALLKLNPYAKTARRQQLLSQVCYKNDALPFCNVRTISSYFDDRLAVGRLAVWSNWNKALGPCKTRVLYQETHNFKGFAEN